MAIRKKTKFLVRFFVSQSARTRHDQEYCGKDLQECISKLSQYARQHVTSFTIYVNGEKLINIPIGVYGKLPNTAALPEPPLKLPKWMQSRAV
jgi:hypothetical protein